MINILSWYQMAFWKQLDREEKSTGGVQEEKVSLKDTVKEKCVQCFRGPNLIKAVVVIVCLALVVEQLTACVKKLVNIPITTYTHFDFNKTLLYPSVTFCREPPYKFDKMLEYGLYAHPLYTSTWRNFDYDNISLDDLWDQITYTQEEFFVQYGLNASKDNVLIKNVTGFMSGRCFTITPAEGVLVSRATRATGYSVTLKHYAEDIANSVSTYPPGYHVYIHYYREPFSEVEVHNGGLIEYLYVYTGEEVDVKLAVDQYLKISDEDDPCTYQSNYSANQCTTEYVWRLVEASAGCSGPWMESALPRCSNFNDMRKLIAAYDSYYQEHDYLACPRFCHSFLYNAFVTSRKDKHTWDFNSNRWIVRSGDAALETQLYIHFNSMMVSVYEERYTYDWNLFLSDLGGSIGFLLGLSVIGLMSIVGKWWARITQPTIKSSLSKKDTASICNSGLSAADNKISVNDKLGDDFVKICNDWNTRNIRLADHI